LPLSTAAPKARYHLQVACRNIGEADGTGADHFEGTFSLRVMTFNIKDGGQGRERLIFDVFATVQPDIILLQEVTYPPLIRDWAEALHMHYALTSGYTYRHVALLSRYPILSWQSHTPFPKLSRDFLTAAIEYHPHQIMTVFGVHLAAQPFLFFEWMRILEISAVLRRATKYQTAPCLIAGDFNAVSRTDKPIIQAMPLRLKLMLLLQANHFPHKVVAATLVAQFFDCYRLLHSDPGYTLPTGAPTIRFDYIFANAPLRDALQDCSVVRQPSLVDRASDHYPVLAEFKL
jgi:exodeoxyribonuclease-3